MKAKVIDNRAIGNYGTTYRFDLYVKKGLFSKWKYETSFADLEFAERWLMKHYNIKDYKIISK